jgi:hypothetical protein
MIQVSAKSAKLVGAKLDHADLTQADLTGADLAKANLSGTTFTQATLDQANFAGATGVPPYSLYLLMVAGIILALLVLGSIRKSMRLLRLNRQNMSNFAMSRTGITLTRGLIGSLVAALGFHLFLGGLVDEVVSASGPPLAQTCSAGALCTVGVASGFFGLFGGVFIILAGFAIRRVRYPAPSSIGMPGGPMGPSQMFGGFTRPGFGGPYGPGTAGPFDLGTDGPTDPGTAWP